MTYDAFLSYSTQDARAVARLHRILESYRPPWRANVERRRLRVFRYQEDQRVSHSLSEDLERRVREVGSLILAASKDAAASSTVALELSTFIAAHGVERLFPVLLRDTIETSVPESARRSIQDPIWIDGRAATLPRWQWLSWGKRRCRRALLPLLARLMGAEPDDLMARERKLRRSEEHTSELQSRQYLVCRLLLEKK